MTSLVWETEDRTPLTRTIDELEDQKDHQQPCQSIPKLPRSVNEQIPFFVVGVSESLLVVFGRFASSDRWFLVVFGRFAPYYRCSFAWSSSTCLGGVTGRYSVAALPTTATPSR